MFASYFVTQNHNNKTSPISEDHHQRGKVRNFLSPKLKKFEKCIIVKKDKVQFTIYRT